ncbi:MAG TPA: AmmeMemoRadiSam system protein B [Acidobacteriota bacterium]|nr:AmmeMemoRadiSam system protein B [Acidobacteriota bacterium]
MKIAHVSFILSLAAMSLWFAPTACGRTDPEVRAPAVAGQFYPGEPARLKLAIQQYLKEALTVTVEKPLAIIVPHAGYIFAGQIYADAYRQVMGGSYDLVIILGTNHTVANFDGISVYSRGAFQTPLGRMPVDETIAEALIAEDKDCTSDRQPHAREHSVEVQIPFIQVLFPTTKIVPVVVGTNDLRMCTRFGDALAKVLKGRQALLVISSDLSHYPPYEDAYRVDRTTLEAVLKLDPNEVRARTREPFGKVRNLGTYACGEAPILAGLAAAKAMGATRATLISYANSGDLAAGDRQQVVGYGAVVIGSGTGTAANAPPNTSTLPDSSTLSAPDKKALLKLARETVKRYLTTDTVPLPRGFSPRLSVPQGAFVTLKKQGELRGCIGHIPPDFQLSQAVSGMAAQAAFNDHRFKPVELSELDDIEIEISVLTPMKPVPSAEEIKIGRDGVVIYKDHKSAVFLPQVAVEQKWGRNELLDNLCLKAGLSAGCWKSGAQLQVFQAEVFDESQFK